MANRKKTTMPKELTSIFSIDKEIRIQYSSKLGWRRPFRAFLHGACLGDFTDLATAKRHFHIMDHPFTTDDTWT